MSTRILASVFVLILSSLGPPAGAAALEPGLTSPPAPSVEASVCATASGGRRLACVEVADDGDRRADGTLCAYDDALGIFGWGFGDELVCVETTEDWGYVPGPGVCERTFGLDEPQVCVNGNDQCLLWVMSIRVVCEVSAPPD